MPRIAIVAVVLSGLVAQGASAADFAVTTQPSVRAAAIDALNDYLKSSELKTSIRKCSILVASHPGKIEDIYGGACELRTGRHVVLCGDTGVGEFGFREQATATPAAVIKFAREKCPGG